VNELYFVKPIGAIVAADLLLRSWTSRLVRRAKLQRMFYAEKCDFCSRAFILVSVHR